MLKKAKIIPPTPEEDAEIQRGIDADPDNPEVTAEEIARMVPHKLLLRVTRDKVTPARAWREYLGLTQQQAAMRAGLAVADYSVVEASPRPDKESLQALAVAFGIRLAQLDI